MHRIAAVSGSVMEHREEPDADGFVHAGELYPPFARLVPLAELIAAVRGVGVNTRRVEREYNAITDGLGNELRALLFAAERDLAQVADERVAEAILLARAGKVTVQPGYDGVYGSVRPGIDRAGS